ncbi:MAG: hypothetical protein KC912_14415 [Proteobacteria bacterium]|nr:hypothetical protein [Pseudomonadota bacterium]
MRFLLFFFLACTPTGSSDSGEDLPDSTLQDSGETGDSGSDTGDTGSDTGEACMPVGTFACPIVIEAFPYSDGRDTQTAVSDMADSYACAPDTDESGGEWVYALDVASAGIVSARLTSGNSGGVDIDVHLLSDAAAASCVARDHIETSWVVQPGRWFIVADSFVNSSGTALEGAYTLEVDFQPLPGGDCAMEERDLSMFWSGCAPGIDCAVDDGDVLLHTPSVGPVVLEAHLVTTEEYSGSWPTSFTDGIAAHYSLSQGVTSYAMTRSEPWAPAGEGGSEFGQGSTGSPVPAADEAWYVNMYWRNRPARGTRILVMNPLTGDAVVASGGYETGPGANTAIGGAVEEIHHHLGTGHRDDLIMGFLVDQTVDLGPIDCAAR